MKNSPLVHKIETILTNSLIQPCADYSRVDRPLERKDIFNTEKDQEIIIEDVSSYTFTNRQVLLIKSLYYQLSVPDKECCVDYLLSKMQPNTDNRITKVSVNTLIHIGHFSAVLMNVKKYFKSYSNQEHFSFVIDEVSKITKYEWNIFKPSEISDLTKWIENVYSSSSAIGKDISESRILYKKFLTSLSLLFEQINVINTKNLEDEIMAGFNPEINEDKSRLINQFSRYDFPVDLSETLDKIDQYLITASDGFDFKGCMDLIRSFTERFYKQIAMSLDNTDGKTIDEKDSEKVARYFIGKGLISQEQGSILIALRHFLSNHASHRLKSKPEDARLSRNLTIEFSLYLLRRLKDVRT